MWTSVIYVTCSCVTSYQSGVVLRVKVYTSNWRFTWKLVSSLNSCLAFCLFIPVSLKVVMSWIVHSYLISTTSSFACSFLIGSLINIPKGGIHKIRHTLRGSEGSTKCDIVWQGGGRILNFVTSHLKNSIKSVHSRGLSFYLSLIYNNFLFC